MEDPRRCRACGRNVESSDGPICLNCGALVGSAATEADEAAALERYHFLLSSKTGDDFERALKNGFVPTHISALLDAGVRLAPLFDDHPSAAAGAARLKMIITRLKLCADSPERDRGLKEIEALLQRHEQTAARDAKIGCLMLCLLATMIAVAGWFALSSLLVYLEKRGAQPHALPPPGPTAPVAPTPMPAEKPE